MIPFHRSFLMTQPRLASSLVAMSLALALSGTLGGCAGVSTAAV